MRARHFDTRKEAERVKKFKEETQSKRLRALRKRGFRPPTFNQYEIIKLANGKYSLRTFIIRGRGT